MINFTKTVGSRKATKNTLGYSLRKKGSILKPFKKKWYISLACLLSLNVRREATLTSCENRRRQGGRAVKLFSVRYI